jgi:hypothetical protein
MFTKTIQRIERILLNDTVGRCMRATKFSVTGGIVTYAAWRSLDIPHCGAGITACVMFASLSTLLGLTTLFMLTGGDEPEGG